MKDSFYFYTFLLALTLFRIAYAGWFELSLDEAYYWLWAQNLDLSYYDHPPMVAYLLALTGWLGESERIVRLSAILCGTGITWFVYMIASEVFNDRRIGLVSAVLINLTPIFAIGSLIITPDAPLCLFWAASLYCGLKIIDTQRPIWWLALGVSFGLALLSKYNAALFAPSIFLFLLVSTENRHWLFRKEPYLAFALSMLIFSPVVYWNHLREWTSFKFQLAHGFDSGSFDIVGKLKDSAEFWGGQVGAYGLFLFLFFIIAAFGIGRLGLKDKRDDYLYLAFMSAPMFLFFIVNSLRTSMEGNWSITAYIAAICATAGYVAIKADRIGDTASRWLKGGFGFSAIFAGLLIIYAHIQIVEPVLPMPQKLEISRRVYGWTTLANESDKRIKDMGENAFIIAARYQISTLLTFYTAGHREAYITTGKGRFSYLGSLDHLPGANALYVVETHRADLAQMSAHFDKVEPDGKIRIERHGELIREFSFYRCYNYHGGLIEI